MPVYNEGFGVKQHVMKAVANYENSTPSFELIVVDDGSTDDTLAGLKSVDDERVRVVGYRGNRGKGGALLFGAIRSNADIVIFADGDGQALPRDLGLYIDALKTADIAIASKRVSGAKVTAGFKRRFLSVGFNILVRNILSLPITDTQAGFKVFKSSALDRILPLIAVKHYAFDVEVLTVAMKVLSLKIEELPANVTLDSNFKVKNIVRMFMDVLGIGYRLKIRKWYQRNLSETKKYKPLLNW
jgi:glycosyltransferase involved in cell wall biosynthesis